MLAQHSQSGTPVMFNQMIQRYSFDIMCTLAFGDARGYLTGKTTVEDEVIFKSLHDSLDVIGLFVHAPWMIKILEVCSMIPGPMKRLNDWSARKVELRRQVSDTPRTKPAALSH